MGIAAVASLGWWRAVARGRGMARAAESLAQEVEHLQGSLEQLEALASVDRLTGAWNRRRFEEASASEMGLARRRKSPLALLLLDLDHFKRINDTYGHPTGDAVLVGAASAFRSALRASDALFRWGGEEFAILAPATALDGAVHLAERVRATLETTPFPGAEPMTLSIGVAEYLAEESLEGWITRADKALYQAKAEGRNRVLADHARSPKGTFQSAGLLELVWEDSYGSGHRLIDEQHIRLFDLSNALLSAVMESQPPTVTEARIDSLLMHTEKHFRDEEALLRKADYPDLDQHRAEHARLLAEARHFQSDMKAGQVDFGRLVTYLATDLVKGHLLTEDCGYFNHLNARLGAESKA